MKTKFCKGEHVLILANRYGTSGGCSNVGFDHPDAAKYSLMECIVSQVNLCGLPDCYGLIWADTKEPVGLPFYPFQMKRK